MISKRERERERIANSLPGPSPAPYSVSFRTQIDRSVHGTRTSDVSWLTVNDNAVRLEKQRSDERLPFARLTTTFFREHSAALRLDLERRERESEGEGDERTRDYVNTRTVKIFHTDVVVIGTVDIQFYWTAAERREEIDSLFTIARRDLTEDFQGVGFITEFLLSQRGELTDHAQCLILGSERRREVE